MLAPGVPSITYGLRGLNYYQIELTGPARDLHSGVYGGAVPNPLTILTELFAKLHDKNFRVTVPGFYDSVATRFQSRTQSSERPAVEKEGFRKSRGRARLFWREGFHHRGTAVDSPDARTQRHLGRLHRRRSENGYSFQGLREIFYSPGARSGSA